MKSHRTSTSGSLATAPSTTYGANTAGGGPQYGGPGNQFNLGQMGEETGSVGELDCNLLMAAGLGSNTNEPMDDPELALDPDKADMFQADPDGLVTVQQHWIDWKWVKGVEAGQRYTPDQMQDYLHQQQRNSYKYQRVYSPNSESRPFDFFLDMKDEGEKEVIAGMNFREFSMSEGMETQLHWPGAQSGVTVGMGLDLGYQKQLEMKALLGGLCGLTDDQLDQMLEIACGEKGADGKAALSKLMSTKAVDDPQGKSLYDLFLLGNEDAAATLGVKIAKHIQGVITAFNGKGHSWMTKTFWADEVHPVIAEALAHLYHGSCGNFIVLLGKSETVESVGKPMGKAIVEATKTGDVETYRNVVASPEFQSFWPFANPDNEHGAGHCTGYSKKIARMDQYLNMKADNLAEDDIITNMFGDIEENNNGLGNTFVRAGDHCINISGDARIRDPEKGWNETGEKIGKGAKVEVSETKAVGAKVYVKTGSGWTLMSNLRVIDENASSDNTSNVSDESKSRKSKKDDMIRVIGNCEAWVNCRSTPELIDNKLGTLPKNQPVLLVQTQGKWSKVQLKLGLEVWVSSQFLVMPNNTVPNDKKGLGPVLADKKEPSILDEIGDAVDDGWQYIKNKGAQILDWVSGDDEEEEEGPSLKKGKAVKGSTKQKRGKTTSKWAVKGTTANLREEHTTNSKKIEAMSLGDEVVDLGETYDGPNYLWRKVKHTETGKQGWVASRLLERATHKSAYIQSQWYGSDGELLAAAEVEKVASALRAVNGRLVKQTAGKWVADDYTSNAGVAYDNFLRLTETQRRALPAPSKGKAESYLVDGSKYEIDVTEALYKAPTIKFIPGRASCQRAARAVLRDQGYAAGEQMNFALDESGSGALTKVEGEEMKLAMDQLDATVGSQPVMVGMTYWSSTMRNGDGVTDHYVTIVKRRGKTYDFVDVGYRSHVDDQSAITRAFERVTRKLKVKGKDGKTESMDVDILVCPGYKNSKEATVTQVFKNRAFE